MVLNNFYLYFYSWFFIAFENYLNFSLPNFISQGRRKKVDVVMSL